MQIIATCTHGAYLRLLVLQSLLLSSNPWPIKAPPKHIERTDLDVMKCVCVIADVPPRSRRRGVVARCRHVYQAAALHEQFLDRTHLDTANPTMRARTIFQSRGCFGMLWYDGLI